MDGRVYWIWLQQALEPGSHLAGVLLREYDDARAVYEADPAALDALVCSPAVSKRLRDRSLDRAEAILRKTLGMGGWIMTPMDRLYPPLLSAVFAPPLVLYGLGDMPDLNLLPAIAVIGTREITKYGRQATAWLAAGLALGGAVVVSGGALGGDAIAHRMAMEAGGITVAVQCCGLDVNYPAANAGLRRDILKTGALLSEYPPGTGTRAHMFHVRNRLMSGMCRGICVTEAPMISGTMITATHAREQGRDVFAVAGSMVSGRSAGTDHMIREGAKLVTGAHEVLEEYTDLYPLCRPEAALAVSGDRRFLIDESDAPLLLRPARRSRRDSARTKEPPPSDIPLPPPSEAPVLKVAEPAVCPEYASEEAKAVYAALGPQPCPLDDLLAATGLTAPRALSALTELELYGCAAGCPGKQYRRLE